MIWFFFTIIFLHSEKNILWMLLCRFKSNIFTIMYFDLNYLAIVIALHLILLWSIMIVHAKYQMFIYLDYRSLGVILSFDTSLELFGQKHLWFLKFIDKFSVSESLELVPYNIALVFLHALFARVHYWHNKVFVHYKWVRGISLKMIGLDFHYKVHYSN